MRQDLQTVPATFPSRFLTLKASPAVGARPARCVECDMARIANMIHSARASNPLHFVLRWAAWLVVLVLALTCRCESSLIDSAVGASVARSWRSMSPALTLIGHPS